MTETRRREAQGILFDHSELFEPPPKPSDEKQEFDLS